mmetsp:Transcript_113016/g.326584  ORF Transcript_113016/g.326584 Transcript_113016/m.326584 type:complete len:209 (+) Transcript_113016:3429-4055(+)
MRHHGGGAADKAQLAQNVVLQFLEATGWAQAGSRDGIDDDGSDEEQVHSNVGVEIELRPGLHQVPVVGRLAQVLPLLQGRWVQERERAQGPPWHQQLLAGLQHGQPKRSVHRPVLHPDDLGADELRQPLQLSDNAADVRKLGPRASRAPAAHTVPDSLRPGAEVIYLADVDGLGAARLAVLVARKHRLTAGFRQAQTTVRFQVRLHLL